MKTSENNFKHRHNQDGSFDSICPLCFRTIDTRLRQEELDQDESSHICDAVDLMWKGCKKDPSFDPKDIIDHTQLRE
jgi:hypothetical protein